MNQGCASAVPTRHRRNTEIDTMLGHLHLIMPALRPPDPAQWARIGQALMQGDPSMDRLLEAMTDHGIRRSREQFETAIVHGIEAVSDPIPELIDFMAEVTTPPQWLDLDRVESGAALFRRCGKTALDIGRNVALMGGYQASAFNRTLILTGALQKGPTRRLAETLAWQLDCTAAKGMQRHAKGWQSTLKVRFIHALVRRSVAAKNEWQMNAWGLPVNQADMAATLYGALTVLVLGSRLMGVPQSRNERDDAAHMTRYIGWLIGVDEAWLTDTEADAASMLLQLLTSLANADETSIAMAVPLADEPLQRPYPNLAGLRGRLERSRNLSISRAFLGGKGMQRLGLPKHVLPWYPAIAAPGNLAHHLLMRALPGGQARLERRGRRAQEQHARKLSLDQPAVIGGALQGAT